MAFRLQCRLLVCPGNLKGMFKERMECPACTSWLEEEEEAPVVTQEHPGVCRAFVNLRVGRDIGSLELYEVLKIYFAIYNIWDHTIGWTQFSVHS